MKKIAFFLVCSLFCLPFLKAQNVQLHYDLGKDRKYFTSTIEDFISNKDGSTYYFVDMDYSKDGVQQAYGEISHEFAIKDFPLRPHVEYNGGLMVGDNNSFGSKFNNDFLLGFTYDRLHTADYSMGISFTAMYKYIMKSEKPNSFQLTAVWYAHFLDRKISFLGFADFWKEKSICSDYDGNNAKVENYIFITEPQIWFNASKQLSLGSEIEMSTNFGTHKGFMINPTLAVKWTFKR